MDITAKKIVDGPPQNNNQTIETIRTLL